MKFIKFKESKYIWLTIIVLTIIAIVFKSVYRQYITKNDINDFGIADTSPNFFAGLIIVIFYFTQEVYNKKKFAKYTLFTLAGLVGYELVQGNFLSYRTFDLGDIIASVLGVLLGYMLCLKFKGQTTELKQNITCFTLPFLATGIFMSCGDPKTPEISSEQIWNVEALRNRAEENLDSDKWNTALFKQDIETYNQYAGIFEKYPLSNLPFPVADYDYAVYSNPFTMEMDSLLFKGIQIGEYKDPDTDSVTTKLTLLVLTNDDKVEPESFVDSRNFPYLTAEGSFTLPQNEYKWIFSASPDGYSFLMFSMKLFDLRFGETIIIYPQKDNSFLYTQIDESPNDYPKFTEYLETVKKNRDNLNCIERQR